MLDVCLEVEGDPELIGSVRAFTTAILAEWELDRFPGVDPGVVTQRESTA